MATAHPALSLNGSNADRHGRSVVGHGLTVHGDRHTIVGDHNVIYGDDCMIRGNHNKIYGKRCMIEGDFNYIYGTLNAYVGSHNVDFSAAPRSDVPYERRGEPRSIVDPLMFMPRGMQDASILTDGRNVAQIVLHHMSTASLERLIHRRRPSPPPPAQITHSHWTAISRPPNVADTGLSWGRCAPVTSSPKQPSGTDEPILADDDDNGCVICMSNRRICAVIDCGHKNMCIACARELLKSSPKCPTCRTPITNGIMRVFE